LIHVLHLIGSTGLYGAERWILALMRAMDTDRFRSTLVNLVDYSWERSDVVQAAEQRGLDAFDFVTGGKFNPAGVFRLAKWAREQDVAIIHGHGFKSDLIGLLAAKIAGCHMMTTPHGWSLEKDRKLQFYEKLDRFSFRFMEMVCPLSEGLFANIKSSCKKVKFISNGVDIDEVRSASQIKYYDSDVFVIGYIGRLIESKDVDTLIYTIKILIESGRNIALELVGDGDRKKKLQDLSVELRVNDRIRFNGFRDDATLFLKSFNCFVLPSLSEGIPRCIMEAMAVKVPVIASNIPGNRNLVVNKETGLLFPVGDSRALADCISFMMDHPDKANGMALRGSQKVENEYSNRKMAREYSLVYEALVTTTS